MRRSTQSSTKKFICKHHGLPLTPYRISQGHKAYGCVECTRSESRKHVASGGNARARARYNAKLIKIHGIEAFRQVHALAFRQYKRKKRMEESRW